MFGTSTTSDIIVWRAFLLCLPVVATNQIKWQNCVRKTFQQHDGGWMKQPK